MRHLIPARQNRPDKDLIFALNGEATRRKQAGEKIVNATIGSLMNDDGTLAVLDTVANLLKQVPRDEWAAYAPIPGTPGYLEAVIGDTFVGHDALTILYRNHRGQQAAETCEFAADGKVVRSCACYA